MLVEPVLVPRFARLRMRAMRLLGRKPPANSNLAEMAAKRRSIFPSFEMALSSYRGRGAFKTWPEETLRDYLRGGLIATGNGTEMRLACDPAWESSVFQHAPPGIARLARHVRCPLTLIYAGEGTARENEVQIVARGTWQCAPREGSRHNALPADGTARHRARRDRADGAVILAPRPLLLSCPRSRA